MIVSPRWHVLITGIYVVLLDAIKIPNLDMEITWLSFPGCSKRDANWEGLNSPSLVCANEGRGHEPRNAVTLRSWEQLSTHHCQRYQQPWSNNYKELNLPTTQINKNMDCPLKPPESNAVCQHLDFHLVSTMSLLTPTSMVMVTIEN